MEQQKFDELVDTLKEKALGGDVEAMKHLGDAYYQGPSGKEKNIKAALPYWRRAVDNGDVSLAYKVACAIFNGRGCEADESAALPYFKLAADAGDREAQFSMGLAYMEGIGCVKDNTIAKKYFEMAALKGDASAQWYLGSLQFLDKDDDWLHWICCAHIGNINKATEFLNHMLDRGFDKESLDYQIELIQQNGFDPRNSRSKRSSNSSEGCYVATAVYGTYDCPEVWTLRRYRDYILADTWYGRLFIRMYYLVSPVLVKWFGGMAWFKKMWKRILDKKIALLQVKGIESTPYKDRQWR